TSRGASWTTSSGPGDTRAASGWCTSTMRPRSARRSAARFGSRISSAERSPRMRTRTDRVSRRIRRSTHMPHARVDLHESYRDRLPELSGALLRGMVKGFDMPESDLFHIFRLHQPGELYFSTTHPEPPRDDIIFIEVLAGIGYASSSTKHKALVAIADEFEALGIPRH